MRKVDHDDNPATDPQIVVTPRDARGGYISPRMLLLLVASMALVIVGLYAVGVLG